MSRFKGKAYKGAMRDVRRRKRAEAEIRNSTTPYRRRRQWRLRHGHKAARRFFSDAS